MAEKGRRCPRCDLLLPPIEPSASFPGGVVAEALRSAASRLGMPARPEWSASPCCAPDAATPPGAAACACFHCPDCRDLSPALGRVVAAFDYAWPGDLLIQRLKLQGRFSCAPVLAGLLASRCQALRAEATAAPLWCMRDTLVTAVPASGRSLVLRGYNPAGEVGRALARRFALAWRPGLIRRSQEGRDQKDLGRRARRLGVQGLYRCSGGVAGREVLVVDDVMTTGSTLSAIADALREQGAAKVWGAVLARTPSRR